MVERRLAYFKSSIVLIVEKPNVELFTSEYLEDKGMFTGLSASRSVNIPVLSQHIYPNGYVFEAVNNRIKVELNLKEAVYKPFKTALDDKLVSNTERLIGEVGFMRFSAVGLNFHFRVEDSEDLQAFTNPLASSDAKITQISYRLPYDDFTANLALSLVSHKESKKNCVQITSNFHRRIEEGAGKDKRVGIIKASLDQRHACFDKAKELIYAIRF